MIWTCQTPCRPPWAEPFAECRHRWPVFDCHYGATMAYSVVEGRLCGNNLVSHGVSWCPSPDLNRDEVAFEGF